MTARLTEWTDEHGILDSTNTSNTSGNTNKSLIPISMAWAEYERNLNPENWPFFRKPGTTLLVTAISFTVQYASAVDSAVAEKIQAEFGVNAVVESLATGM